MHTGMPRLQEQNDSLRICSTYLLILVQLNESAAGGLDHSAGAVRGIKLSQDPAHAVLGSLFGDAAIPGDLLVQQAARHQAQDFFFSKGEFEFILHVLPFSSLLC